MKLQVDLDSANRYIGRTISKEFPGYGVFVGEVTEVQQTLVDAKRNGPFFRIQYEDGDSEDIDWSELQRILDPPDNEPMAPTVAARKRAKQEPATDSANGTSTIAPAKPRTRRVLKRTAQEVDPQDDDDDYEPEPSPEPAPKPARAAKRAPEHAQEQQPRAKRGRNQRNSPDVDEQHDYHHHQQQEAVGPKDAGYEAAQDDDADDAVDDDDEALLEDDSHADRSKVRSSGLPGHLCKIKLENFMCHEHFEMDFGPHVTFVSGTNGSGKSAVLQALQICLGATARNTGRSASLAGFIRTGAHEARVHVTLWNTGPDAYLPRELGDRVTIERRIGTTNSWRLLSARGKCVGSKKKEHIDPLLDHFGINAANPLAVMTQDTSRTFLSGGAVDRKKYELFMQGTMLQGFKDALTVASNHMSAMANIVKEIRAQFQECKQRREEVAARVSKLQEGAGLAARRALLQRGVAWSQVAAVERELARLEGYLGGEVPQLEADAEKAVQKDEEQLSLLLQQEQERSAALDQLNAELASFASSQHALRQQEKSLKGQLKRLADKVAQCNQKLDDAQFNKQQLLSSQAEDKSSKVAEYEQRMAQYSQHMDQVKARHHSLQSQLDALRSAEDSIDSELEQLRRRMRDLREQAGQKETEKRNMEDHLRQLRSSNQSNASSFGGPAMQRLLQLVAQHAQRFSAPPIGPLGMHLRIVDNMWGRAVESALGGAMEGFICANSNDVKLLYRLAKEAGARTSVFTANFHKGPHQVPPHKVVGGNQLVSCMSVLQAEHPQAHIIMNTLIDNVKVERIALARSGLDRHQAGVADFEGSKTLIGVDGSTLKLYGAGGRTAAMTPYRGPAAPRVSSSIQAAQQQLQEAIASAGSELGRLHGEIREVQAQLTELENRKQAARRDGQSLQGQYRGTQREMQDLAANVPVLEAAGDDGYLQGQVHELDSVIAQTQLEVGQQSSRQAQLEQQAKEVRRQIDETIASNSGAMERSRQLLESLQALGAQKAAVTQQLEALKAVIAELQRNAQEARDAVSQLQANLVTSRAAALEECPEEQGLQALADIKASHLPRIQQAVNAKVASGELHPQSAADTLEATLQEKLKPEKLLGELAAVDKKLDALEKEAGGSMEELQLELERAQAVVEQRQPSCERLTKTYCRIREAFNLRDQSYRKLFAEVAKGVSEKFRGYMQRRQHTGTIDINEDNEDLKLRVKIGGRKNSQAKVVHDLKQLSGGERSYTTVSFILALGHWTESPFRAMDEYDVYMDAINRRVSTETLLEFALDNPDLQFIFLTPQDMQAVRDAQQQLEARKGIEMAEEYVRIRQMPPARR